PACAPDTVLVVLLLVLHHSPLNLHSFPTRRSSDLEAHVLLVFFEPSPSDYIYYIVPGYQAGQVIDSEATDILADYIDRYYYSDIDRKSTRLNSSHVSISYAVFCLKKKNSVKRTGAV